LNFKVSTRKLVKVEQKKLELSAFSPMTLDENLVMQAWLGNTLAQVRPTLRQLLEIRDAINQLEKEIEYPEKEH